MVRTPPHISGP